MKIGMGYDIHRLAENRKLFLGGVEVPHPRGLMGHSDGDVLIHAIIDAILGACSLGDIGTHFPDTDPELKGISSLVLLARTREMLGQSGRVEHIDSTVVAQSPRIAPHIGAMRGRISGALGIRPESVSIKAKTAEGIGAVGKEQAIEAYAIAVVDV